MLPSNDRFLGGGPATGMRRCFAPRLRGSRLLPCPARGRLLRRGGRPGPGRGSSRLSSGVAPEAMATTSSVRMPPAQTERTVPSQAAVTPLSNAPSSFEEPMKIMLTEAMRPRSRSGEKSRMIAAANHDAHAVENAAKGERHQRQPERPREGKDDHRHAEAGNRPESDCGRRDARADGGWRPVS